MVLMDVRMPNLNGIDATRRISQTAALSKVAVIMLTTFNTDREIFAAIRAGASGYLLKDAEPDELRAGIRRVAAGDALLSAAVTKGDGRSPRHTPCRPGPVLSARPDRA